MNQKTIGYSVILNSDVNRSGNIRATKRSLAADKKADKKKHEKTCLIQYCN